MKPPTPFSHQAEQFWRRWLPKMVAELEKSGRLETALKEAEERVAAETDSLRRHFVQQGLSEEQAETRAWEIVRYRYAYLRIEA